MKKMLSIVLCAATASAFAEGEPVVAELGTVGVTAITTSLSNAIVAVSYDDLASGEGMVYSNLVKTANLTPGDRLVEFRDDKYTSWVLEEDTETTAKYWKEQLEAFVDSAGTTITLSPKADAASGAVGTGIWLVRQNPIDANGNTNSFYIYGKPSSNREQTLVAEKWNLVGNPLQSRATISGTFSDGDEIVVPLEPAGRLCRYTYAVLTGKSVWRKVNAQDEWEEGAPILQPGLGCWIRTKEGGTISWSASN